MAVAVFTRTLVVKYRVDVCSFTFLVWLLGVLIISLIPALIIYGTGKVWDPVESLGSYQAKINYKYDFIMKAIVNDDGNFVVYSTRQGFNALYADFLRTPAVTVTEVDNDNDQVKDFMEMELNLPLMSREVMQRMEIIMMFHYHLKRVDFKMESIAYLEIIPDFPRSIVDLIGNLRLVQLKLLPDFPHNYLYNVSIINDSSSFEFFSILKEYQSRSVRTEFKMVSQTSRLSDDNNSFVVRAVVSYQPQSNIVVNSCIFRVFIWNYIQIVYISLIFAVIIAGLNKFIFSKGLLPAVSKISLR